MNREEKSPVSFVLFVQSTLIRLKATRNYSPAFIDGSSEVPKRKTMWQSTEDQHARQGCKYGATTNPDDQLYLDFHSPRKSVASVATDESNRVGQPRLHACWPRRKCPSSKKTKIAMQLNRVANQLRLCIAKIAMKFLKSGIQLPNSLAMS